MSIAKFITYQHHHPPTTHSNGTDMGASSDDDDAAVLDTLYDNPPLLALLRDATHHGDLSALRAALAGLDPAEGDHAGPTVLMAELLVRMIMTSPAPDAGRDNQVALIDALHDSGLCHAGHFHAVLILAALEHGATVGHLPASIYDTAQDYITHHDPELADYLNDIQRRPD